MNAFSTLILSEHLIDLQHEADAARLARRALDADANRRSAVLRLAGRSARGLSRGLAALAARVDPLEPARSVRSDGSARRMAV